MSRKLSRKMIQFKWVIYMHPGPHILHFVVVVAIEVLIYNIRLEKSCWFLSHNIYCLFQAYEKTYFFKTLNKKIPITFIISYPGI